MSTVAEILSGISHRLPGRVNIYPALNRALRMIAKRLKYHDLSIVRDDLSLTFTADSSTQTLPSDYWGLLGAPYISGKTWTLKPLPNIETKLTHTTNSEPRYYEIMGTIIKLVPGTSSEITICGDYWKRPTKLSKPTDTIPYSELFDDVLQEALIHVYGTGGSSGNPNDIMVMDNFIRKSIDEIAPDLDRATPMRTPVAFNYDQYMR